jgi:WD40 repeat protein
MRLPRGDTSTSPVLRPSFSADGHVMATIGYGPEVLLWAMRDGLPVGRPRAYQASHGPGAIALSPDGRTLVLTTFIGVEIVDVPTLRRRTTLSDGDTVISLDFTPDGRQVIGGSIRGWTRLWSIDAAQPTTPMFGGHTREVIGAAVSPDGRTLATGAADGTIRLVDLQTEQPVGAPLSGPPVGPVVPQFSPDGAFLFAISATGRSYRWDVRPSSWARHACAVAGRKLTHAEWADVLPGREYAPACADQATG